MITFQVPRMEGEDLTRIDHRLQALEAFASEKSVEFLKLHKANCKRCSQSVLLLHIYRLATSLVPVRAHQHLDHLLRPLKPARGVSNDGTA